MRSWLWIILLCLAAPATIADTLRCGTKLVSDEDTLEQVLAKCGEPAGVQHTSVWRRPLLWIHGRPMHVGQDEIEIPVELWTYNFGPNKFMRRIRFEDGLVVEIKTLGYGYIK